MKKSTVIMKDSTQEFGRTTKAIESRQKLLLAGMEQFAEKGYSGASVRDIVGSIGYSVPSISAYFGGKEGLANAIVETLKQTFVQPVIHDLSTITTDRAWRVAVKGFVSDLIGLFASKDEPNRYFAALYRHESANLHAKKVTLHEEIMVPIFHHFERLIELGVPGRDKTTIRLATLSLWNNVLAYALKHPETLAADVPEGIDPKLFREMTIDYMVEVGLSQLNFTA
ncbi:MAG: TetR family transcriptional regulator [Kiritimatiellae bacterium]|nr:TetR family transcriptional regulator [Kiritimatiellia bacterium]